MYKYPINHINKPSEFKPNQLMFTGAPPCSWVTDTYLHYMPMISLISLIPRFSWKSQF